MKRPLVVKIGGAALRDPQVLAPVVQGLRQLWERGEHLIVVHGGGPAINQALEAAGITWSFIDGLRVTTPEMMTSIQASLWTVNRLVVKAMLAEGLPALGLDGQDARLLSCEILDARLGQVGKPVHINSELLLNQSSAITVLSPVGTLADGSPCNINADMAAAEVAVQCEANQLYFLTDTRGILDSQGQTLSHVDKDELKLLEEAGTLKGGMLAKTRAVYRSLTGGVQETFIMHGLDAAHMGSSSIPGTKLVEATHALTV